MNVEVKISGSILNGTAKGKLLAVVERWVRNELQFVQRDMERRAPRDTGNYATSFTNRVVRRGLVVSGTVENTTQPVVLQQVIETGRTPGKRMPPSKVLLPWMARHGIPADREFLIRRKIGRDGLPPHFIFRFAHDREKSRFRGQTVALKNDIVRAFR